EGGEEEAGPARRRQVRGGRRSSDARSRGRAVRRRCGRGNCCRTVLQVDPERARRHRRFERRPSVLRNVAFLITFCLAGSPLAARAQTCTLTGAWTADTIGGPQRWNLLEDTNGSLTGDEYSNGDPASVLPVTGFH